MSLRRPLMLLVGDNPFHGISHLSQDRGRARGSEISQVDFAARIVTEAFKNGANGFMFSVSETTLSILEAIRKRGEADNPDLYAIVPYAYEYVRLAAQTGGVSGLAKRMAKEVILSRNLKAITMGAKAVVATDLTALMKTYILYEISRIKSSISRMTNLKSVLLHEMITEIALSLGLDWFVKSYIEFISGLGIQPGFETRNFAYLVRRFNDWNIDFREIMIVTSFNKTGFQMNPSRTECEKALTQIGESKIIAMSILAAGYLKLPEAIDYIAGLPNLSGVVVGVSKKRHSSETFALLRRQL